MDQRGRRAGIDAEAARDVRQSVHHLDVVALTYVSGLGAGGEDGRRGGVFGGSGIGVGTGIGIGNTW